MQSQHDDGEEIFFDSLDFVSTSFNSSSSQEASTESLEFENSDYQVWMSELRSIHERRARFLRRMGFDELVPPALCQSEEIKGVSSGGSSKWLELDRLTENSGAVLDSLGCSNDREKGDLHGCIKDLDRGKKFVVHEFNQESLLSTTLRDVDSGILMTWEEFEMSLGVSHFVQQLMLKDNNTCREKQDGGIATCRKKSKSSWKGFSARRRFGDLCKSSAPVEDAQVHKSRRTKVYHHGKRCKELTAVSMCQELQAHRGSIWSMKFSPDGRYLVTSGEDCVVRIWRTVEMDTSGKFLFGACVPKFIDKVEQGKLILKSKHLDATPLIIPRKTFKIEETPLHEFSGHTSDILDLSWSKSNCLLTSSKDKTVRLWKVGEDHCLKVFRHNDYVTCVQFDPVDENHFISGSIDGKVRIWGISETRVVEWVDIRCIITAVCYRPDGQGFVVGSITGSCHFYYFSGNSLELDVELNIQGKKKTTGKRITGFQFCPQDPEKIMITCADARVRIFDGVDVIHKYRGPRKSRSQLSASFTSDGRYIVSMGEDSHVYIWNHSVSSVASSYASKSIRSCEYFFSKDASVVIPWPGMDDIEARTRNSSLVLLVQKNLEASTWVWDAERFSLGAWFFADCLSRVSATWPEEKLSLWADPADPTSHCPHSHDHHLSQTLRYLPADAWSRVIVTAGHDGVVRSFYYYGLPVR